jgi:hypothetical protein
MARHRHTVKVSKHNAPRHKAPKHKAPKAKRTKVTKRAPTKGNSKSPAAGRPTSPTTAPRPTSTTPLVTAAPDPTAASVPATPSSPTAPAGAGTAASTPFRFFSPTSIWNTPLLPNAPIASNSAAIEGTVQAYINSSLATRTGPWINTTQYSTPIYTVPANQPTVPVIMDYNNPLAPAMGAVPIPSNALPAAGTDEEATIYQPSSDTLWEMWKLRQGLNPPPFLSGTPGTGGSLAAGTYDYAVTALTATGETTVSPVQPVTVAAGGKVSLRWNGPIGATSYRIYRGTSASTLQLVGTLAHVTTVLTDPNCVWTDTGATASSVSPPTINTATTPGQWHASWGGRMFSVSQDPGYYRNIANPLGGWTEQSDWGVTASGLPVVGGLITLADLASGQINHAIAMMVPQAAKAAFVFPALRTDGTDASPGAIPEGAWFRLPPTLDLSTIPMPPIIREIAVAAQKYGFIVNDQTGATVGFRAEDPTPLMRQGQSNPYLTYFANPATGAYEPPNELLASFPWSDLELVAPGQ